MDFGTAIGLLSGIGIIAVGVLRAGGELYWFYNFNSVLIVFGGTLAATLVNYPLKNILGLFTVFKNVFKADDHNYLGTITALVEKGEKARKNGVLSLEADLPSIEDHFLKSGIELAINERDPPTAAVHPHEGGFLHDPHIRPNRQFHTAGHSWASDGCDHGFREFQPARPHSGHRRIALFWEIVRAQRFRP